jgi:ribonuclease BN (tRNA processing enzyme)
LRWMNNMSSSFRVYGPPGTKALVKGIVASMAPAREAGFGFKSAFGRQPIKVGVVEIGASSPIEVLPGFNVTPVENSHYSFAAGSREAKRSKSLSFRIEAGGRVIVYTGDTGPSEAVTQLAKGADLLVSEVQNLPALQGIIQQQSSNAPPEFVANIMEHLRLHHLSPEDVGRMAQTAGVKRVILTHLGPAPAQPDAELLFLPGVRSVYSGPVTVAQDLARY